jgi:subtilisin family serine protease
MTNSVLRRAASCVALCAVLLTSTLFTSQAAATEVRESYIVLAQDNSSALAISRAMSASGLSVESTQLGALDFVEVMLTATQAATWSQFAGVRNIEVNQKVVPTVDQTIPAPSGSDWNAAGNWGLDRIDQASPTYDSRYSYATTGAGVDIYIIDTGIRRSHSEFAPASTRVAAGYYRSDLGSTDDGCGHGTHVAGIAAGATYGVAKAARIIPVRVFPGGSAVDCARGTTVGAVIDGVNWVISNHTGVNTAVANMSLGATRGYSASLDAAVIALQADGVSVVVAAGNEETYVGGTNYATPACTEGTISVGATRRDDQEAEFSNYGDCVNIMAPGYAIKSAWPTVPADPNYPDAGTGVASDSSWALLSGTSMAAPFVAGAVARLLEIFPTASPSEVANKILATATPGVITMVHGVVSEGTQSSNLFLYTSATTPSAPGAPSAVAGDGAVTLSWGAPANGGSAINSYSVASADGSATCATTKELSCTIAGLQNLSSYTFTVTATNVMGTSTASPASSAVTPSATWVTTPEFVSAVPGNKAVVLTWTAAVLSSGAPTGYVVKNSAGVEVCRTTAVTCTVGGLANGSLPAFSVEALGATAVAASQTTPKVVVGGLVQKVKTMKVKSRALLTKVASTMSKGKTTWTRNSGSCAVSGKYLVAASRKGSCVFRVSVAKKAPFTAQKLTVRLQIS